MPKRYGQACPVAKSLEVLGDRWTLLIVRDLLRGTRRFQDLQAGLPGIAPNILSDRLKLMESHRLVSRAFYSDHPPRAQYTLTERGQGLGLVVGALADWGSRHVYKRARLVHADCGKEVRLGYHCADCGTRVRGASVELRRAVGRGRAPATPRAGAKPAS
jgi:DNA-binding HxlR family transcriptional regulator